MTKKSDPTIIILDLEATCWDRGSEGNFRDVDQSTLEIGGPHWKQLNEMEIIEIGAVKVKNDYEFEIIDQFQTFVRPVLNPILTDFCKNLTTISQKDVDNAPYFKEAFLNFRKWSGKPICYMGWGKYDYKQIQKDCLRSGLSCFSEDKYINGKDEYFRFTGKRAGGLGKAVRRHNLKFEGTHHRAISDAIMTAKVIQCARKMFIEKIQS